MYECFGIVFIRVSFLEFKNVKINVFGEKYYSGPGDLKSPTFEI